MMYTHFEQYAAQEAISPNFPSHANFPNQEKQNAFVASFPANLVSKTFGPKTTAVLCWPPFLTLE